MTRFTELSRDEQRRRMEETVRTYFDGCNEHRGRRALLPARIGGPWIGSRTIAENWAFSASSPDARAANTLQGYDYVANQYQLTDPVSRPHPEANALPQTEGNA